MWNHILVVTKEEILPWYKTLNNLYVTIRRYKDKSYGIKRVQLGGNGRQMLILFDSLDANIQLALGDPRTQKHPLDHLFKYDGDAVTYFAKFSFDDGTYLKIEKQEEYILNASVLKAIINYRAWQKNTKSKTNSSETLSSLANSFQKILVSKNQLRHTLPTNERRFNQALKAFETIGYNSIVKKNYKNQNSRKVTDDTISLLNNLFSTGTGKPTATEVHRKYDLFIEGNLDIINNSTGELYNPILFKKLSDATVKGYLANWNNKIGTHALRSGDRQKYIQKFKPYHSLDKPKYAGSIISIDDRQPPFKALNGKRIWFYNGIDLGSEAFTCWVYGETKEGLIMKFYQQLVRNYYQWGINLPGELEAEMSLNSSYTNTFLREGVMFEKVRIEANNARGKRIEGYYRTLRYEYEKDRSGWLARPFAIKESNQAGPDQVPAIPYENIIENCLLDIETWNNMPHSVHTHMSRWKVFMEMQNPNIRPTNYTMILYHIGYKTKTSCNVGIVKLNRGEFLLGVDGKIALGNTLIDLMKRVEGEQLTIHWLDDDSGQVIKALVYIETEFICEAIAKPTYNRATLEQTPIDKLNRETMSAYVATIEAFGKKQRQRIDGVTTIDNRPKRKKEFSIKSLQTEKLASEQQLFIDKETELIESKSFVKSLKDNW